jgi:hypothetical protein
VIIGHASAEDSAVILDLLQQSQLPVDGLTDRVGLAQTQPTSQIVVRATAECAKQHTGLRPSASRVPRMPRANTDRRRGVPPIVAAVVQPVARRLSRIEALLIEIRFELDVQLKRAIALQAQLDALTEHVYQSRQVPRRRKRRA